MDVAILAIAAVALYAGYRVLKSDPATPAGPVLPPGGSLAMVGDSLGVGMQKRIANLGDDAGVRTYLDNEVGALTSEGAAKVPPLHGYDVLVVALGTNDAAGSGRHFEKSMQSILVEARDAGVPVVWAMPTGRHLPGYETVVSAIGEALERGDLHAVPAPPLGPAYASDRIHLTPAAYTQWADDIWNTLRR